MALDPSLVNRVRELLNKARVMSESPAGQPGQISRRHPSSRPPPPREASLLEQLGQRLASANTDERLRELVEWAELQIRLVTHGPDREPETREQFRYRVCIEYESKPARLAADRERVSIALIRQIREQDNRDPRTGRKRD